MFNPISEDKIGVINNCSNRLVSFAYYTAITIAVFNFIAFTVEANFVAGLAGSVIGIIFAIAMIIFMKRTNEI